MTEDDNVNSPDQNDQDQSSQDQGKQDGSADSPTVEASSDSGNLQAPHEKLELEDSSSSESRKLEVHWSPSPQAGEEAQEGDKPTASLEKEPKVEDADKAEDTPEIPEVTSKENGEAPFPLLEKSPQKPKGELVKVIISKLSAWVQATRPSYFIVTLFPLLLGLIVACHTTDQSRPGLFVLILIASLLVHAAANMCNDYFEEKGGVDSKESLGGSRVLQEGKIKPEELKIGIIVCYLIAFIMAIFIAGKSALLWLMVLFAAFSSFFYVAPPIKYGHRALGELMVFLNMGIIMVTGTFIALTGIYERDILVISIPPAFMVAGILFFQSLPEILKDREAGKITLAGILGKDGAALIYLLWWPFVWLLIINLYLTRHLGASAIWCLLAIPIHVLVVKKIYSTSDWVELDKSGYLVKLIYLITALAMLFGAAYAPQHSNF
jgi:1,4-dihydroxy-2-naphthoate octaprenyltransferase